MALWAMGILLSLATLYVAFLVLKRDPRAARTMMFVFVTQLVASMGEITKEVLKNVQTREFTAALWPGLESAGSGGWVVLNGEMLTAIASYTILSLFYLGLLLNVRSKSKWAH